MTQQTREEREWNLSQYSDNEKRLFKHFGYEYLLTTTLCASDIYRLCVEEAFIKDMKGPEVEALRRGYKALNNCNPYRMTPEFEMLIQLGSTTELKKPETICFDFDGVINSYTSGFLGPLNLPDPPIEGVRELIATIRSKGYRVVVQSVRAAYADDGAKEAIEAYLIKHNIIVDEVTGKKPKAKLYIDDRGFRFTGDCDAVLAMLNNLTPWYET